MKEKCWKRKPKVEKDDSVRTSIFFSSFYKGDNTDLIFQNHGTNRRHEFK